MQKIIAFGLKMEGLIATGGKDVREICFLKVVVIIYSESYVMSNVLNAHS